MLNKNNIFKDAQKVNKYLGKCSSLIKFDILQLKVQFFV